MRRPSIVRRFAPRSWPKTAISLATSIALVATVACSDPPAPTTSDAGAPALGLTPEQASRVLAKVGDRTITLGDFAGALDRMDQFDRLRYQTPERRRELLKELIDVELLAIEARKRGLDKSPEAEESIRQILRDALLAEVRSTLPSPAEISQEEVRAYYQAHLADYREPERRRVSAIVVADEKKAKAVLEAWKKAPDPTSWGKLFFEHSLNAPKEKESNIPLDLAGDLGIVGPTTDEKGGNPRVPEPVRAAVFNLAKVGDVLAEPVVVGKQLYVVRLSGMTAGHERSLEEADRSIRVALLQQKTLELENKLDADLRKKYKIEIDDGALAKLGPPADAPPPPSASAAPSETPTSAPLPPPKIEKHEAHGH
jgi:peptidyl-prolyl cis-trans isomerase C